MQSIKSSISRHLRIRIISGNTRVISGKHTDPNLHVRHLSQCSDQTLPRVIELVKKFDGVDAAKVTEKADFQKDLSLDSLDRVELVMALEQEFSLEIPEEKAEKLTCCADVASYIISESESKQKV